MGCIGIFFFGVVILGIVGGIIGVLMPENPNITESWEVYTEAAELAESKGWRIYSLHEGGQMGIYGDHWVARFYPRRQRLDLSRIAPEVYLPSDVDVVTILDVVEALADGQGE